MIKTGFRGTFAIRWSQTEIDGFGASALSELTVGAAWSWRGDAVRLDGPSSLLQLDQAEGRALLHNRAARVAQRLVRLADPEHVSRLQQKSQDDPDDTPLMDKSFVLTDGRQCFAVMVIDQGPFDQPLLMFVDEIPPQDKELWIVRCNGQLAGRKQAPLGTGMICFTPGTVLRTAAGPRLIEDLRVGDQVQTKDNGPQPICWIGRRRISGARMRAMPALRPLRIQAHAFAQDEPDQELVVSPGHRILLRHGAAQALFNTPEVLVTAQDLLDHPAVHVDTHAQHVDYIHIMFDAHQVLWANGVETESFHPASAALDALEQGDRYGLLRLFPELDRDPHWYGGYARRALTPSEAALMQHAA